ncbi:hypothetical protein A2291_02245 [candidate division WOR-1 bacterium RIFOXYB2_FULL_42_35]|uniref:Four helix bundle protein n=1 Tax=candidate division WOR-1 bacterium RIFOXYC2_FULL_41_25 TaxID=1802586 RepID=A0A1F4TQV1_UNCSA|nr:MAG: hypothetical protein A2247_02130 [candidate division WOR-1 bacterium RIFOXYA2_FULL_41_14]OGC24851.1 MAG: hypothetical protein A2291_02245 [candidate division WOR-1 bacterium RIFOXYB2_FULL_42_35]OGC35038.1 MAG: hypothetical protein A2462_05865 [candidate division WOR-1 bacterium RIFOXYC2_FULL_41_25]OGC43649.1 MAG: hypothetical protein A2548_07445 [candidate division WOR-1 bacterium RIFOXYD2_FULL_41_8]
MKFKDISIPGYQNEDIRKTEKSDTQSRKSDKKEPIVPRHERLWVWRKAHELMILIYNLCKKLPKQEYYRLIDQIQRSSKSVADNIAEGNSSYYFNNKIKSYYVSRKEAGETQGHIREMENKRYINSDLSEAMISEYEEVMRGINGLINKVCQLRDLYNSKGSKRT